MNYNTEHFPAHPNKANRNYFELGTLFSLGKPGNSVEHTLRLGLSFGSLTLGEASCHVVMTLIYGEAHLERN